MDSVNRKKAKLVAAALENDLLATDPRFNNYSKVITCDGSIFDISNSFIVKLEELNYIVVFAEHYDTLVFELDEVDYYGQYQRISISDRHNG